MEGWGTQPLLMTKLQSLRRGDDTSGNEPVTIIPSAGSALMASPRHTASSNPAFSRGGRSPGSWLPLRVSHSAFLGFSSSSLKWEGNFSTFLIGLSKLMGGETLESVKKKNAEVVPLIEKNTKYFPFYNAWGNAVVKDGITDSWAQILLLHLSNS